MLPRARLRTLSTLVVFFLGCVDDVEVPPKAPTLFSVTTPTTAPIQKLRGSRPANTAVLNGDEVVVELSEDTSWAFDLPLVPGDNTVELFTQRPSGLKSRSSTTATITYEPACPDAAVLDRTPPSPTNQRAQLLAGNKPAGTAVVLDGAVVVPADASTRFSYSFNLPNAEGSYAYSLTTRDARGRDSDPLRFTIVYDVTAPLLGTRYPTAATDAVVANTSIPTGSAVFVELSEEVRATGGTVAPDLITVTAGSSVAGTTTYAPTARTFVWTPMAPLAPSTTFTVTVDVTKFADLAGNAPPAGALWTWTFTTGTGPSTVAPAAPTATSPATITTPRAQLDGTREQWSAIYVNGELAAAPGPVAWTAKVPVVSGPNPLNVTAQTSSGASTAGPMLTVTRTVAKPAAPVLDASVPNTATEPVFALVGTKPAGTAVLLGGLPVVCLNGDTTWAAVANLDPGFNELRLTTRDADGNESDALLYTVNFAQSYSGKVPSGWQLKINLTLRDLSQTRIADEFVTGANNYGLDVWLEGPVAPGETCQFDAALKQRKAVKYVATISHYIGVKTGHTVPFADDDYRGTDYIAALAHGKVLEFLGVTEASARRDGQGRENPMLMARVTESDLRQKIDCFGLLGIDGCTEATVQAGAHAVDPWEPRKPPNAEAIEQGDYLLFVQMNLDRSGNWLTANDYETCWGNPADLNRGMHRVVRRVALGPSPWSVQLSPADEISGPDPIDTGEAKFLAPDGMTITWGPP